MKFILFLLFQTSFIFCQIDVFNIGKSSFNINLNAVGKQSFYRNLEIKGFKPLRLRTKEYFKNQKIIYPKNIKNCDIGIVELSSKTLNNKNIIVTYYLLVINYKETAPIIYKSVEGKLDFSNREIIVDNKKKIYTLELETRKGKVEYVIDYNQPLDSNYTEDALSDSLILIDVKFSIPLWYNNIKYGVKYIEKDTICMALFDENDNGLFNEKNIDRIIISNKRDMPYFEIFETPSSVLISDSVVVKINNRFFNVNFIAPQGNLIYLDENFDVNPVNHIYLFEKIPETNYLRSDSSFTKISETAITGKYFFVYFWIPRIIDYRKNLIKIDSLANVYSNKITTLSLLKKGSFSELKNSVVNLKLASSQGLSNVELNRELHIDGSPYGVIFGKDGTFLKSIRSIQELIVFLENNE
jgi:hypothetical protein